MIDLFGFSGDSGEQIIHCRIYEMHKHLNSFVSCPFHVVLGI